MLFNFAKDVPSIFSGPAASPARNMVLGRKLIDGDVGFGTVQGSGAAGGRNWSTLMADWARGVRVASSSGGLLSIQP